jgi:hypothetical protein
MRQEWEYVTEDTERLVVPGGWLYRVQSDATPRGGNYRLAVAVLFVPGTPR